jgi:hypothetical protein
LQLWANGCEIILAQGAMIRKYIGVADHFSRYGISVRFGFPVVWPFWLLKAIRSFNFHVHWICVANDRFPFCSRTRHIILFNLDETEICLIKDDDRIKNKKMLSRVPGPKQNNCRLPDPT